MSATPFQIERIAARKGSLGEGMEIARALPTKQRRMIGAWCFLDHLGPIAFSAEDGMHVGAHPHTRLQTFTWMIEGEIMHRDSLGSEQVVRPGQVNLMTAGYGISHTEDSLRPGERLHAAQLWIALPDAVADQAPAFAHYPQVPQWSEQGCSWSLVAGHYGARTAPTQLFSPLLGLEVLAPNDLPSKVKLQMDTKFEYGLIALTGGFTLEGETFVQDELAYLSPGGRGVDVHLDPGTRLLVIGGEPFTDKVTIWWNFLGQDLPSIRAYREQWEAEDARFGNVVGGEARRLKAPSLP
ncbi:pirin family protein [Comamonas sp. NoAH]|uniref:pirin family protein n=1 Tax=Comamonas halotolerans TaxID=3041496 RepID=UPI0024E13B3D|nr:pirin family protein [Comamonas sp. NoAH]